MDGWTGRRRDPATDKTPTGLERDDIAKARATWETEEGPWVQAIGTPRRREDSGSLTLPRRMRDN